MKPEAIAVLCLAALIHASWNLLAKKGLDSQVFIWLSMAASSVLLLAPAALLYNPPPPGGLAPVLASGGLEAAYVPPSFVFAGRPRAFQVSQAR